MGSVSNHDCLWHLVEEIEMILEVEDILEILKRRPSVYDFRRQVSYLLKGMGIDIEVAYSRIFDTSSYHSLIDMLRSQYDLSSEEAENNSKVFVHSIVEGIDSSFSPKKIAERVNLFINELEGNPLQYVVSAGLLGIHVESDSECTFYDGVVLEPDEHFPSGLGLSTKKGLEFAEEKTSNALHVIRLFQLTSAYVFEGGIAPISFFKTGIGIGTPHCHEHYETTITRSNRKELIKFYNTLMPLIEKSGQKKKSSFIKVALDRFSDSITNNGAPEERITLAITSLEALFLKFKEREGLSRRLAQRLAILLSCLKYEPNLVYDTTMKAYDIRSTYIHGGMIEESTNIEVLCHDIQEFVRAAIISFVQVITGGKHKIITLLDKSLIDVESKNTLMIMVKDILLPPIQESEKESRHS